MSPTNINPEQPLPTADDNLLVAEKPLPTRPESENDPLSFPIGAANSLDERLASDLKIVQFILSVSEASFKGPVRHFFNPGGQQLQFIHNVDGYQSHSERIDVLP